MAADGGEKQGTASGKRLPGGGTHGLWEAAFRRTLGQFASMLPIILGVILVLGLVRSLVPSAVLQQAFSGPRVLDVIKGAGLGSILAGNPINSYIIGGQLLTDGGSFYAVAAFVLTWVTVGIVQLPAEAAALGGRFAITRNLIAFLLSLPIAFITVGLLEALGGLL